MLEGAGSEMDQDRMVLALPRPPSPDTTPITPCYSCRCDPQAGFQLTPWVNSMKPESLGQCFPAGGGKARDPLPLPEPLVCGSPGSSVNSYSWSAAWELGEMLGGDRKYIFVSAPGSWHRAPKILVIS